MIELGSDDLRQQLPLLDAIPDIDLALLDVAAGAGEDVGDRERGGRGRQADHHVVGARAHRRQPKARHEVALLLGCRQGGVVLRDIAPPPERDAADEDEQDSEAEQPPAPSAPLVRVMQRCHLHRAPDAVGGIAVEGFQVVHPTASLNTPCAVLPSLRLRSTANRYGTTSSVVGVANSRPPITARASAAFCSSPAPPIAIGIMPTIIAAAVISTGRIRVCPASIAAWNAVLPASCCSRAKVTSRMEFADATPTAMIAHENSAER